MRTSRSGFNPLQERSKQIIELLRTMLNGTKNESTQARERLLGFNIDQLFGLFRDIILQDAPFRELVTWGLLQLDPNGAIDLLIELLSVTNEDTRRDICGRFSRFSDPRVVTALLQCLQDESPNIRSIAAFSLGKVGDGNVISALEGLVIHDSEIDEEGVPVKVSAEEAIKEIHKRMTSAES